MEIYLDKQAVKQIRVATADAIEEGDQEALKDDIIDAFPEEQVENLEQMLGGTDFAELLDDLLEEWSGDDTDELFELLETQLGDHGVDLKYHSLDDDDDGESDDEDDLDDEDELDEFDALDDDL
ncbi:MAG: hypothetical protein AAF928_06860 [Myxococcota bacterium]